MVQIWRVQTTPAFTAQALAGGSSMRCEKQACGMRSSPPAAGLKTLSRARRRRPPPARSLRRMAERHSFWPPGLRAVAARRSKALNSSAPPCQISPHAPARPGSACRNDAGTMGGCGEHASGTAAHSQGRSRLSREGGGSGRVRESRGARRACARVVKSVYISSLV